jgi:hypothetical protein
VTRSRFGLVIAAVLLLTVLPARAAATHSNGAGPNEDFAVGTAEVLLPPPFGRSRLHINWPPQEVEGLKRRHTLDVFVAGADPIAVHSDLLCLEAVANSAIFRGVVTRSTNPLVAPGSGILGRLVDNGEDGSRPDEATAMLTPPPTGPAECPPLSLATSPVEQGNYVVHDSGR